MVCVVLVATDLCKMKVPWWALSPSPFTVAMYAGLAVYGAHQIKDVEYRSFPWFMRWVQAGLVLGQIVLQSDLVWCLMCLVRFGDLYPSAVPQLVFCILRDLVGYWFCVVSVPKLEGRYGSSKWTTGLWVLNVVFLFTWFHLAPDPSWTDWTYAIKYDYGWTRAWSTFLISHVLGRMITGALYVKGWEVPRGSV